MNAILFLLSIIIPTIGFVIIMICLELSETNINDEYLKKADEEIAEMYLQYSILQRDSDITIENIQHFADESKEYLK